MLHLVFDTQRKCNSWQCDRIYYILRYSVSHNFIAPYFFAGNQGNHQNFKKSLVPHKLWLIWIKMKQKAQNRAKTAFFVFRPFWILFFKKKFFCFIPMKINPHLQDSKDFLKFWWLPWFPAQNNPCLKIKNI